MLILRTDQIQYCNSLDIYIKYDEDKFRLFKSAGHHVDSMPDVQGKSLYISDEDRTTIILQMQADFNLQLIKATENCDAIEVKKILSSMLNNAMSVPEPEVLQSLAEPFGKFVDVAVESPEILCQILKLSKDKYSTVEHSVNVAALTLNHCVNNLYSDHRTYHDYALCGLFHDIGKAVTSEKILNSPNQLTDEQFKEIKKHPTNGAEILKQAGFNKIIQLGALEHHLKMDGSGYPKDVTPTGEIGRLIGIIDAYEALTSINRTYRKPLSPMEALELIKSEVHQGKFDELIFREFVKSLGAIR